jgi:aldose sugar dehydrogenase
MKTDKKLPTMLTSVTLLGAVLTFVGFLLGLRSATQHDQAYFAIKEMKAIAVHDITVIKDKFTRPVPDNNKYAAGEAKAFVANDFSLQLIHIPGFGESEKTAGFVFGEHGDVIKIEQSDADKLWAIAGLDTTIQDARPTNHRGGGLKQIFDYRGQKLGLFSMQSRKHEDCYFASLVNLTVKKEIFRAPCLPFVEELDFSSIGGAWTETTDGILMSLGTPSDNERISTLAQDPVSPYGKVLSFTKAQLLGEASSKTDHFTVHSSGHRNPQGMLTTALGVYSIDHGPKGGDEINMLTQGSNYGWPLYSLGSTYQGEPHKPLGDPEKYTEPLFAFIPSIAPSDITACPSELTNRYAPLTCVLISSLRGMSIFVGLIDSHQHRVVSLERISVDMRLREFFKLPNGHLAVSTDGYGVFEIGISDLATFH